MNPFGLAPSVPDLAEVIAKGDRRASLQAIRDHLALRLVDTISRDVAPIGKLLIDTIREIDEIPAADEMSKVDDIAAQRERRRAEAARRAETAGVQRSAV